MDARNLPVSPFKFPPDPSRISAHVENRSNSCQLIDYVVVDRKRKPLCQHSVETVMHAMDARMHKQRIDVCHQAFKEVMANSLVLSLV